MKQNNKKSKAVEYTIFEELELLQQYFLANVQCFPLTTNQHQHQHKPNFSEMRPCSFSRNLADADAYVDLLSEENNMCSLKSTVEARIQYISGRRE